MRLYKIISQYFVILLGLIFLISPSSGTSPSFDPGSGRDYDTFGGFFDQFGQYVDPMGGVMDQYGEYIPDSYSPACDTYYDSKGQIYGGTVYTGQLKEGDWLFGNIGTHKIDWPDSISLTRNSDCNLVGTYYNTAGRLFTTTIHETRRFLGTTKDQIALNLVDIADPKTQEKYLDETARANELAELMLQNKFVDDEGYINFIRGVISNTDAPDNCPVWNVGFYGYSFDNGKRFRAIYYSCIQCNLPSGEIEQVNYNCMITLPNDDSMVTVWPWASLAEENLEGDWLGDGQDIIDSEKTVDSGIAHGTNPYGTADWGEWELNLE